MEQPIPDWLDKEFLAQCLRSEKGNQNIEVTDFHASLAAPAGNNYGGCVVRVRVQYKESNNDQLLQFISLIVKSEVTEGPYKDVMNDTILLKEPTFYKKFLPAASKFLKTDFAPKTLFCPKPTVTVMEDLKENGFMMADRLKQLDFDHCRLYMEAAASFHAVSLAVHKDDPELIESLGYSFMYENEILVEMFKNMIRNGFDKLAHTVGKMEPYKKYRKLIEDVSINLWDKIYKTLKSSSHLKTLTQGDPWTPNMMFKYDDNGAVKEVKLLDFQALTYTCPVNDLVFFIWTSATHDVRRNRLNDLYKIYLDALNMKLQDLNCPERLTFDKFMESMQQFSYFMMYIVGSYFPFVYDPEPIDMGVFSANETGSGRNPYDRCYTESFCNTHLTKVLDELKCAGVFAYLEKHNNKY